MCDPTRTHAGRRGIGTRPGRECRHVERTLVGKGRRAVKRLLAADRQRGLCGCDGQTAERDDGEIGGAGRGPAGGRDGNGAGRGRDRDGHDELGTRHGLHRCGYATNRDLVTGWGGHKPGAGERDEGAQPPRGRGE